MSLFGTDGIRGVANKELTPELAFKVGRAGAYTLKQHYPVKRPFMIIGRDTRISGDMLESALVAGICSVGVDIIKLGVIPTPAVAWLVKELGAMAGVVISASHNPVEDNGIKFFGANGYKLPDEIEKQIETDLLNDSMIFPKPLGAAVGRILESEGAKEKYLDHLLQTCPEGLQGLRIVVDCAHGAASAVTPDLLKNLGAEVYAINSQPDGTNINKNCGSTNPRTLQEEVRKTGADLGLAHDGDADRLLAVDEHGELVDGDQIMVICALSMKQQQRLKGNKVIVTVMSNLGLYQALAAYGIEVLQTKVGDRYVLEEMLASGAVLGGEQSGHIIFLEHNTTGDGVITGLELLKVIKETGRPLSSLAAQMVRLPQVLKNARVKDKDAWQYNQIFGDALKQAEAALGNQGRILVRASGTEPLLRIMAEGPQLEMLQMTVGELVVIAEQNL